MTRAKTVTDSLAPTFGRLVFPKGIVEGGQRADFRSDPFEIAIAAHGYRLGWSRRSECPCALPSMQVDATDPNCPLCDGSGYLYFGPETPQDLHVEQLTAVQQAAMDATNSFMIRGIMTGLSTSESRTDRIGTWVRGGTYVTTVWDNKLGFRDRLIQLDAQMPYSEVVKAPAPPDTLLKTRYIISGGVFLCRSIKDQYRPQRDFIVDAGRLRFLEGRAPPAGTRLSMHYLTFPTWLVEDFSHRERTQNLLLQTKSPTSPEGNLQRLPLQARVSLEFLANDANDGGA